MRSYAQYCPLANGLDLVGERWTLLIVRELGIRPARYGDLHDALPGIATNLLAERLRTLTEAGIVEVFTTPPPAVANVYALTGWGQELYEILVRLGRWGARTLLTGAAGRRFRARYVIPVAQALYGIDADLDGLEPVTIAVDSGDDRVRLTIGPDGVVAEIDDAHLDADVLLDGTPETTLGLLSGLLDPVEHRGGGCEGRPAAVRRFRALTRRASAVLPTT